MRGAADEPWPSDLSETRLAGRVEIIDGPFDETALTATYDGVDIDEAECRVVLSRDQATIEGLEALGPHLASLRHPNVVPILAAGRDETLGVGFVAEALAQPPLRQQTLRQALDTFGPLPPELLPAVGRAAAEGLAALHARGLVHGHLSLDSLYILSSRDEATLRVGGLGQRFLPDRERSQKADVETLVSLLGALCDGDADFVPPLDEIDSARALADAFGKENEHAVLTTPWQAETTADALAPTVLERPETASIEEDHTVPASSSPQLSAERYAPLSSSSLLGLHIGGRFHLERLLGEGGMGAVYEATGPADDSDLPERVAIKIIRPGAATEDAVKRFMQEARLSRDLDSEHTVRVFAVGHDAVLDAPFMVMELLVGQDLRQLSDETSPLEPPVATRIVHEAALGVAEAHDQGLVHRDIKPSNLFLHQHEGGLLTKVCDFGVAKLTDPGEGATKLTATGGLLGSPAYMAPEQARDAKRADARADVWSLGITLYELLSGRHPWHGAGDITELLVWLQMREPVPLRRVAPWVSPELCAIVHRALERVPDDRYPDARAFADALEPHIGPALEASQLRAVDDDLLAQAQVATPVEVDMRSEGGPVEPRRPWRLVGVVTALAVGAGALWSATRSPIDSGPAASPSTTVEPTSCTSHTSCSQQLGEPAVCQPQLGCVALENEHCRVEGGASDPSVRHDDTLWIGAMFPGEEADEPMAFYGTEARRALSLARADFMSQAGGLLATKDRPARPIGLLHCDDAREPVRVAEHLIDVGVSAVIGFSSSREVVTLASQHFIPNNMLVVPTINMGAQIDKIPHPIDSPRLVWRTVASQTATVSVADTLVTEFIEPRVRAENGDKPIRVAVARDDSAVGVALGQEVFSQLRFNGTSITDNGDDFRQVVIPGGASVEVIETAAEELGTFDPDVVIVALPTMDELLLALETPASRDTHYITITYLVPNGLPSVAAKAPAVLSRIYSMAAASSPANDRYAMHFNAAYKTNVTPDNTMATPYDALYLVAYAAFAQPEDKTGGSALARGIGRLLPPGEPIEVGPRDILTAFSLLGSGKNIDLIGTYGPMDFDARTGSANPKWNVVCPVPAKDEPGKIVATPTGLVLDGDGSYLTGELRCPGAR